MCYTLPKTQWVNAIMRKFGLIYSRAHGPAKVTLLTGKWE